MIGRLPQSGHFNIRNKKAMGSESSFPGRKGGEMALSEAGGIYDDINSTGFPALTFSGKLGHYRKGGSGVSMDRRQMCPA